MFHPVLSKARVALACLGWLLGFAALPAAAHDYQSFSSDGARIAYTDYGSDVPVIFLHALNGSYAAMAETRMTPGTRAKDSCRA